jgi:hypothetical protein
MKAMLFQSFLGLVEAQSGSDVLESIISDAGAPS